jgi:hypothetical protein
MVFLAMEVNKEQEKKTFNNITYMNEILKSCVFHLIREQLGIKIECGSTSRGKLREVSQNIFHLPYVS